VLPQRLYGSPTVAAVVAMGTSIVRAFSDFGIKSYMLPVAMTRAAAYRLARLLRRQGFKVRVRKHQYRRAVGIGRCFYTVFANPSSQAVSFQLALHVIFCVHRA
jgi:hypothetical protein